MNLEQKKQYNKEYRIKNLDKLRKREKEYRLKNKDERKEANRQWYYSEKGRSYYSKVSNQVPYICSKSCFRLKDRAKKKNLKFNLDADYLMSIYPKDKKCKILGFKMRVNRFSKIAKQDKYTPTVNRINPKKGYVKGNVEIISQLANSMLCNANKSELIKFKNYLTRVIK